MNNFFNLVKGELIRLKKYKIIIVGFLVSLLWAIIIGLSDSGSVTSLIPMLIMMDSAMMSIILLASSFYLEKQEGTIKSLLVAPVNVTYVLISKVLATIIVSLISGVMLFLVSWLIHHIYLNIFLLIVYISIIVISHTAIGFVITLHSKDFGQMIGLYAIFALISIIPSLLFTLEVIPSRFDMLLLISPTHSAQILLNSLLIDVKLKLLIMALLYLVIIGSVLYVKVVYPQFKKYAIGG